MSERKTIVKLFGDPSKAEEIAFIEEVAEGLPENSYLKMLFTKNFINWVREQIRNDFYPNLYEYWQQEVSDTENLHFEITRLKFEVEDTNKVLAVKEQALKELQGNFAEMQENAGKRYDKLELTMNDTVTQYQADIWNFNSEITNLKKEIVELKAKLYDMMVAKEN